MKSIFHTVPRKIYLRNQNKKNVFEKTQKIIHYENLTCCTFGRYGVCVWGGELGKLGINHLKKKAGTCSSAIDMAAFKDKFHFIFRAQFWRMVFFCLKKKVDEKKKDLIHQVSPIINMCVWVSKGNIIVLLKFTLW